MIDDLYVLVYFIYMNLFRTGFFFVIVVVDKTLEVLRYILPRDVVLQVFVKWFHTIRAPGSDVTTPLQCWTSFSSFLLGMMGYQIDQACLGQYLNSESSGILEAVAKKFKLSDAGSDEVMYTLYFTTDFLS